MDNRLCRLAAMLVAAATSMLAEPDEKSDSILLLGCHRVFSAPKAPCDPILFVCLFVLDFFKKNYCAVIIFCST
jgi:hypothetical protein